MGRRFNSCLIRDDNSNVLRKWVREQVADPAQAFPGHGQVKSEQLEIDRLRNGVAKLKAERDILKKATVGSTGQGNIFGLRCSERTHNGTHRSPWLVARAEG